MRAALELIAEKGPAGFTFADAARWAGVSPAAPYRHFRDRDELMSDVARRGFDLFAEALKRAWGEGRPDPATAFDRLGKAYLAGFDDAIARGYRYAVEIDADGSHDPAELPAMLALAEDGADLVIGSRWVPGGAVRNWPWLRKAISRAGNTYSRVVLRSRIQDITAGFRVFRVSALRDLDLSQIASQGYCFQVELAWRLERTGHRIAEHPITFVERATGRSKMHSGIVLEALLRVTAWGIAATVRGRS